MTNASFLAMLRRRLRDVDELAPLFDDAVLWGYVADALLTNQQRKVSGLGAVALTGADPETGFTTDIADDIGLLLVLSAGAMLLRDLYRDRVRRGELGTTWTLGLEQGSTLDQRKAYEAAIAGLEAEAEELKLIRASATSGFRAQ